MNSYNQLILSVLSMAVLVKCYPLQNYGHLLEESSYGGGSSYGGEEHHEHEHKHEPGMPYKFGYKVYDPHHGTSFGQNEHSDGDVVKGSYEVLLPDGRLQQVTYTADWKTGYHADVQYHGEAIKQPEHHTSSGHESYEHAGYTPSYSGSSEHSFSGY